MQQIIPRVINIKCILFFALIGLLSCEQESGSLPILGRTEVVDGQTIHHKIRNWEFVNQDSVLITNDSLKNHVYITDVFFTSCPTICPKVMKQMLVLHDEFRDDDLVKLVSFTIDPKRDDVDRLKLYSSNLGVTSDKWHFLTGDKDDVYELANDYFIVAYPDADTPGGFDHSGKIILTDKDGHVRAFAEGTEPETIPRFIKDVKTLKKEYE